MIARNTKSLIIAAAVLLVSAPRLHAVQLDAILLKTGSEQVGAENPGNQRQISSGGVIVTWSETNDELRGFSQKTGDWEIIRIAPQKEIVPIVFLNMAAVRFGDSIAAFSGIRGWWDVIELSKDSKSQPTVSDSLVQIEDNGHLYTFAAEKASWTSPTDMTLQPAEETMKLEFQSSSDARVPAKSQRVVDGFRKWKDSLPRYKREGMNFKVLYSRQDATLMCWATRQRWMPELTSKLEELCRLVEAADSSGDPEAVIDVSTQSSVTTELEEQISSLQTKLNALRSTTPQASDTATPQPDKTTLRRQVEQAFDVRQQLQELEARKLRLKLQLIEANLTTRRTHFWQREV